MPNRHVFAVFIAGIVAGALLLGCGGSGGGGKGEPVLIRISHPEVQWVDPNYIDPITGGYYMGAAERNARLYAEQQVLEKLNVKLSWEPYLNWDTSQNFLRSVLADDPLAELVFFSGGSGLLAQNALQPLDDYSHYFEDEDSSWLLMDKMFGHNYFLVENLRQGPKSPLCYNIGILNRVPALKENGKTVLPVDLWMEGKWTWSVFEDYLQKIRDFYGTQSPIYPYGLNFDTALMALHANGASVYGPNGLEVDSPEAKEAITWLERLISRNLLYAPYAKPGYHIGQSELSRAEEQTKFRLGELAFVNVRTWGDVFEPSLQGGFTLAASFNERGDTMGVVPFPRPDRMGPDDPDYRQLNDVENSYGILRGVSPEMTDLTIRAFKEYMLSYYKEMAGSERALDYLQSEESARASALANFFDVTNDDYGDKMVAAWQYMGSGDNMKPNEYLRIVGLMGTFQLMGQKRENRQAVSPYTRFPPGFLQVRKPDVMYIGFIKPALVYVSIK